MANSFLGDSSNKNAFIKREILRLCIEHDESSISYFSKTLGISVPTITKLIGELIDDGFLLDEGN